MTNYDESDSPDWTPDNPHLFDQSSAAHDPVPQRRALFPAAAVAAALLVGALGGVASTAVISGHDVPPGSALGNISSEADLDADGD